MDELFYCASQDKEGGIWLCEIDDSAAIRKKEFYPLSGVAWLCTEGNRLYALLREPFMQQSGIVSFEIHPDGTLSNRSGPVPTHGSIAAHLLARRGKLYCANYLSGTVVLMPDNVLAFSGSGPVAGRQECSHPHCVTPCPDGRNVAVTDLGTDRIRICSEDLRVLSETVLPPGSGPRHLVFSPDGSRAYCSLELSSQAAVLSFDGERLTFQAAYSTVPEAFNGRNSASAVRIGDDGNLYVSNRGHGSVCVFEPEGDTMSRIGFLSCGIGAHIRDFNFIGNRIICGDEANHRLFVFPRDASPGSVPVSEMEMPRPWCIIPAPSVAE